MQNKTFFRNGAVTIQPTSIDQMTIDQAPTMFYPTEEWYLPFEPFIH